MHLRTLASTLTALTLSLLVGLTVTSSPEAAASARDRADTVVNVLPLSADTIRTAMPYVREQGVLATLDVEAARRALSPAEVQAVERAVQSSNDLGGEPQDLHALRRPKRVSGRHGYIESHWYGVKIHADSYLVSKIVNGTATAATIAAGIGVVLGETGVGTIAAEVVAAALALISTVGGLCQADSGAANYYWLLTGGIVCNPFA